MLECRRLAKIYEERRSARNAFNWIAIGQLSSIFILSMVSMHYTLYGTQASSTVLLTYPLLVSIA